MYQIPSNPRQLFLDQLYQTVRSQRMQLIRDHEPLLETFNYIELEFAANMLLEVSAKQSKEKWPVFGDKLEQDFFEDSVLENYEG